MSQSRASLYGEHRRHPHPVCLLYRNSSWSRWRGHKGGREKEFDLLKKVENCSRLRWVEVDNFEVALLLDCEEAGLKKIGFELSFYS